ncbi:MAG: DUF1571 domain-containing protein [Isosphaeraceae bacterium]
MAIPMTGPILTRNDTRSQGRRWLVFGMLTAAAALLAARGDIRVHDGETDADVDTAWSSRDDRHRSGEANSARREPVSLVIGSGSDRNDPDRRVALKPVEPGSSGDATELPIARALRVIKGCQTRYQTISDYVCTFTKRERIDGRLRPKHVMSMKVRTRPRSVYLRFREPSAGREAIYIHGQNDGKVVAHDVGIKRLLAGTLNLDPKGGLAMEDCRHPITQAGIGPLLDTLEERWSSELDPSESQVAFDEVELGGSRPCLLIETTHPRKSPSFMFHQVRLFVDQNLGLPVRFEAYDWPSSAQAAPELLEEYTYSDLKLNVGLRDIDFDASNAEYDFGRF